MDRDACLEHIRRAGHRIADAADGHLKDNVPSCPDYDVGSLLLHTGAFCRWVAESVQQSAPAAPDFGDIGNDPIAFHLRGHEGLLEVLSSKDPDEPVWSWGKDRSVRFWLRRATQELAVHRWDVENAVGDPSAIDPEVAVDGIDELFDEFAAVEGDEERRSLAKLFGGTGQTIHLHATDCDGEWLVRATPERLEVTREHGKGDVAARGPACDLLLFLWGRVPRDRLEVFGDPSLLDRWQERIKI